MSNEYPARIQHPECSMEDTNTSSSSRENLTNKIPSHVVNFKESKTHLFYVIQPDNEANKKNPNLIRIKISKERPTSRKLVTNKMLLRSRSNHDVTDQETMKKIPRSNITSIHKKTDHPSFVVLPEVGNKRQDQGNVKKRLERNQSTSDNSNETYVVRSKEQNKIFGGKSKVPTMVGTSMCLRNSQPAYAVHLHGIGSSTNSKSEDYCECDKVTACKPTNKFDRELPNLRNTRTDAGVSAKNEPAYLKKEELFNICFVKPSEQNVTKRLRAGQDYERQYRTCYMCPNMRRIFPPTSNRQRAFFESDNNSNTNLKNRTGYVKINFILVRQCLISASTIEKCEVLDAICLRMKSSDLNLAINTIEGIVKSDLFGVRCECRSKPLLEDLFWPINGGDASYQLQTSIARFVNALVSFKLGRNYFNNRSIIRTLTWGDIGRDDVDKITGDNLIAIMMKLSSNRFQRSDMIKNGLLNWLLKHMEEEEYSISKYHLQCMTGLLRNLLRGCDSEDLSSVEIKKLIVLLGRYLDTENITAKRYVCDSLVTLFQDQKNITTAKELNFQRVIDDHVTGTGNIKQKEHLRAVHKLLNRSGASKSFSSPKFDYPSEEEPFLDADLETDANSETDYYPGECLLREKFSGDTEVHFDKKNFIETPATDNTRNDGPLISRVFVEHLNSFLPDIEKNRIFPLCNDRCAEKTRTCPHVGEYHPKKRQPYIPPNSRTARVSRPRASAEDSVEGATVTLTDKHLDPRIKQSNERTATNISTISHDKTAAKWRHYDNTEGNTKNVSKSSSMGGDEIERIFMRRSMATEYVAKGKEMFHSKKEADPKQEEALFPVNYDEHSPESFGVLNSDPTTTLVDQDFSANIDQLSTDIVAKKEAELLSLSKAAAVTNIDKAEEDFQRMTEEEAFTGIKQVGTPKEMYRSKSDNRLRSSRLNEFGRTSHRLSDSEIRKTIDVANLKGERLSGKSMETKNVNVSKHKNLKLEDLYVLSQNPVKDFNTRIGHKDLTSASEVIRTNSSKSEIESEIIVELRADSETPTDITKFDESGNPLDNNKKLNLHASQKEEESDKNKWKRPSSDHTSGSPILTRAKSKPKEMQLDEIEVSCEVQDTEIINEVGITTCEKPSDEPNKVQNLTMAVLDDAPQNLEVKGFVTSVGYQEITSVNEVLKDKMPKSENKNKIIVEPEINLKVLTESSKQKDNYDDNAIPSDDNEKLNPQTNENKLNLPVNDDMTVQPNSMSTQPKESNLKENDIDRKLHARSQGTFANHEKGDKVNIKQELHARSEDQFANRKGVQQRCHPMTTVHQLQSKSAEALENFGNLDNETPKEKLINLKTSLSENTKMQHENLTESEFGLHPRSQEVLTDRQTGKKLIAVKGNQSLQNAAADEVVKLKLSRELLTAIEVVIPQQLHARSVERTTKVAAVEKSIEEMSSVDNTLVLKREKFKEFADKDFLLKRKDNVFSKKYNVDESGDPESKASNAKADKEQLTLERQQSVRFQLFKSRSDELIGSKRKSINKIKLSPQLLARPDELVNVKQKERHSTQNVTTLEELKKSLTQTTNSVSGYSSRSSVNRSHDCVDCEGIGYVLRARASQPCDVCKVSLSKYPKFVMELTKKASTLADTEQRVVTRTQEEEIKVTWLNKPEEKFNSERSQNRRQKEIDGKSPTGNSPNVTKFEDKDDFKLKSGGGSKEMSVDTSKKSRGQDDRNKAEDETVIRNEDKSATETVTQKSLENETGSEPAEKTAKSDTLGTTNDNSNAALRTNDRSRSEQMVIPTNYKKNVDSLFLIDLTNESRSKRQSELRSDEHVQQRSLVLFEDSNTTKQPLNPITSTKSTENQVVLDLPKEARSQRPVEPESDQHSRSPLVLVKDSNKLGADSTKGNEPLNPITSTKSAENQVLLDLPKEARSKRPAEPESDQHSRSPLVLVKDSNKLGADSTEGNQGLNDEMSSASPNETSINSPENQVDSNQMTVEEIDGDSHFKGATFDVTFNKPVRQEHSTHIPPSQSVWNGFTDPNVRQDNDRISLDDTRSLQNTLQLNENLSERIHNMTTTKSDQNVSMVERSRSLTRQLSENDIKELKPTDGKGKGGGLHVRSNEMIAQPKRKSEEKLSSPTIESKNQIQKKVGEESMPVANYESVVPGFPSDTVVVNERRGDAKQMETSETTDRMLAARSLDNTFLLCPRSNEMVRSSRKSIKDAVTEKRNDDFMLAEAIEKSFRQELGNRLNDNQMYHSTIPDEVLNEERILSSESPTDKRQTASCSDKRPRKVRVVSSSCLRQLLNNDKLIEVLSEKVFEKLSAEMHICGPNCKSQCGGMNTFYKASENNQNSK